MTKRRRTPTHLGADGQRLFDDLSAEYAIGDAAGLALLMIAGQSLDRMRAAQAAIAKDGEIILDRYNKPRVHPAAALEKDARAGLLGALKMLNLDIEPLREIGRPPGTFGKGNR